MIEAIRARNYGCLTDVEASLTPLHAFVGPNDSGKSTLLHTLRTVVQFAGSAFVQPQKGTWKPFDPVVPTRSPKTKNGMKPNDVLLMCRVESGSYALEWKGHGLVEHVSLANTKSVAQSRARDTLGILRHLSKTDGRYRLLLKQLRAARLVCFDPHALRRSSGLIPESQSVGFIDDRGHGLPGVYFAIRARNEEAFAAIVESVRQHFPMIRGLCVREVTSTEVILEADLVNGVRMEPHHMSEGLLYYLALAALRHLEPVSLLLVEKPENGLHPARIGEVVRLLRAIVEEAGTQVVVATHSPLVVNALMPDEVSVVTRKPEEGTRVRRIKDTPAFEERSKHHALGELWIEHANGEDESLEGAGSARAEG
jgi:predicted ATPase